jgi:hypothetical protein
MANKLHRNRAEPKGYLAEYLAILLLTISGLDLQAGVLDAVKLVCWGCAILLCFAIICNRIDIYGTLYRVKRKQGLCIIVRGNYSKPLPSGRKSDLSNNFQG